MKQNKSFFFYIIYLCFLFVCFWCYFLLGFRFLLFCLTSPNRWWDNHVANLEYQMLDTKLNSKRDRVYVYMCVSLLWVKEEKMGLLFYPTLIIDSTWGWVGFIFNFVDGTLLMVLFGSGRQKEPVVGKGQFFFFLFSFMIPSHSQVCQNDNWIWFSL